MNKFLKAISLSAACAAASFAQTALSSTALSGSITSYATTACVASATNISTPSLASGIVGSILVVDGEAMQVSGSGPTTTCFKVKRAIAANSNSNAATAHGSGAKVWIMGPTVSSGDPSRPTASTAFLSQKAYQPFEVVATPSLFGVSTGSIADVAGKLWYGAIEVDMNTIATGACILNGSTVGTDKWIVALYDATGALLANSTTAGTTTSGASQYQCLAFTSPLALQGPAQYFVALQGNGTTDHFQAYASGAAHSSYPTGSQTGTFGTLAALSSVPTTFTASVGPLMTLY